MSVKGLILPHKKYLNEHIEAQQESGKDHFCADA